MFLVPQLNNFISELCGTCSTKIRLLQTFTGVLQEKKIYVLCFQGNSTRFHVAMHLFSNTSQMMWKCVKNKKVAHKAVAEYVSDVLIVLLIVLLSKTWLNDFWYVKWKLTAKVEVNCKIYQS